MTVRRVKEFHYLEFRVVIGQAGGKFRAVGFDRHDTVVHEASAESLEEAEAAIKSALAPLSSQYIGIDGAISMFLKAFPGGFSSDAYRRAERDYKDEAVRFVAEHLSRDGMAGALGHKDFRAIADDALRAMRKTNLVSPFEQMALGDALKRESTRERFAVGLFDLLYGPDFDAALDGLAAILKRHGAAKWTVLTYWPYFRYPKEHMFLKPEITQDCAYRLGYDLDYDSYPNPRTYRSYLSLVAHIRDGIASLEPRDNIDIQSFMYVVGKEGYVLEAVESRRR